MYVCAISEVTVVFEFHSKSEIRGLPELCEDGTLKTGGNWKSKKRRIEGFDPLEVDLTPTHSFSGESRATIKCSKGLQPVRSIGRADYP